MSDTQLLTYEPAPGRAPSVVRGWIDHRLLSDALRLNEDELPILAQTVGALGTTLTSLAD